MTEVNKKLTLEDYYLTLYEDDFNLSFGSPGELNLTPGKLVLVYETPNASYTIASYPLALTAEDSSSALLYDFLASIEFPLSIPTTDSPTGFQVVGTKIYDPSGQEFIAKGVNVFTWDGTTNINNYINTWGFNTVRIPNYLLGGYGQPHPADDNYSTNRAIVDAYTKKGVVVIFDAHDQIGSYYEGQDLEILKDYWRAMAQEFKNNPYVWFNLHNEPGTTLAQHEKWVSYHRDLIRLIRDEGAQNTIVIDGETWGQDYQTRTILNKAGEVMTGNENIMFSLHIYDQWGDGNEIGSYIDQLHAKNIPIMIGEYGDYPAAAQMMQAVQDREVGRVAWVAMADDLNDFTTEDGGHAWHYDGSNADILTGFGELILEDMQRSEDLEQLGNIPQYNFIQINSESGQTVFQTNRTVTVLSTQDDQVMGLDDWHDRIQGQGGDDVLKGLGGNDTLNGAKGNDHLFGDDGNDHLMGRHGNDLLVGDLGDDLLKGGKGIDILDGGQGDDTIHGGRDHDWLAGGQGRDQIHGGAGEDTLVGGADHDVLDGGKGNDYFVLEHNMGVDTISRFQVDHDVLVLPAGLTIDQLDISIENGDTLVYVLGTGTTLTILDGVTIDLDNLSFVDTI